MHDIVIDGVSREVKLLLKYFMENLLIEKNSYVQFRFHLIENQFMNNEQFVRNRILLEKVSSECEIVKRRKKMEKKGITLNRNKIIAHYK